MHMSDRKKGWLKQEAQFSNEIEMVVLKFNG